MNKIIAVFLVALCMTVCVTAYSDGVQADLQDNLILSRTVTMITTKQLN